MEFVHRPKPPWTPLTLRLYLQSTMSCLLPSPSLQLASMIMFKDWDSQNASQIATELCGFVTILAGTFLLHKTKDMGTTPAPPLPVAELSRQFSNNMARDNPRCSNRHASPDRNFEE